jgi:hypothetical protein
MTYVPMQAFHVSQSMGADVDALLSDLQSENAGQRTMVHAALACSDSMRSHAYQALAETASPPTAGGHSDVHGHEVCTADGHQHTPARRTPLAMLLFPDPGSPCHLLSLYAMCRMQKSWTG